MLVSDVDFKSYTEQHITLKIFIPLTKYRFNKVKEWAKLKISISHSVTIELKQFVHSLHTVFACTIISEFSGVKQVTEAHLTRLKTLLYDASKGCYGRDIVLKLRDAARDSIGSVMQAKFLELKHKIHLI